MLWWNSNSHLPILLKSVWIVRRGKQDRTAPIINLEWFFFFKKDQQPFKKRSVYTLITESLTKLGVPACYDDTSRPLWRFYDWYSKNKPGTITAGHWCHGLSLETSNLLFDFMLHRFNEEISKTTVLRIHLSKWKIRPCIQWVSPGHSVSDYSNQLQRPCTPAVFLPCPDSHILAFACRLVF